MSNQQAKDHRADLTWLAHRYKLGNVSMHVWEACCMKYGLGGTFAARAAYRSIMLCTFQELDIIGAVEDDSSTRGQYNCPNCGRMLIRTLDTKFFLCSNNTCQHSEYAIHKDHMRSDDDDGGKQVL